VTIFTADTTMGEILAAPAERYTAVLHAAEAARVVRSVYPTASVIEFAHAEYDRFPTGVLFTVWPQNAADAPLFDYNLDVDGGEFSDDQLDLIESLLTWAADADPSELFTEAAEPDGVAWALDLDEALRLDRLHAVGRVLHYATGADGVGEQYLDEELDDMLRDLDSPANTEPDYDDTRWSRLAFLLDELGERQLIAELAIQTERLATV
jgi:hypothetical protein